MYHIRSLTPLMLWGLALLSCGCTGTSKPPAETGGIQTTATIVDSNPHVSSIAAVDAPPSEGLAAAIADYQRIQQAGGWPAVPGGTKLALGMAGPRVLAVGERLAATGDLDSDPTPAFDAGLSAAVARFQRRHGLEVDGIVGKATLAELNVPVAQRLAAMEASLRRLRQREAGWGDRYLVVNIAAATYRVVESGRVRFEYPAIVGRPSWQTPVLDGVIERLDFNPSWTVPPRIASLEILPKIQRDPSYLARHHMHYVDGQIRQDPGPDNPLGVVKFYFDNPYSVYLHDTNNRDLFSRYDRFLSHGCVRIADAVGLARYLLKDDPAWPEVRISELIQSGRSLRIQLMNTIPIHIVYDTAWVDSERIVQFRRDVYHRQSNELAAMPDSSHLGGCPGQDGIS